MLRDRLKTPIAFEPPSFGWQKTRSILTAAQLPKSDSLLSNHNNPKSAATRSGSGLFSIGFGTEVKEEKLMDLQHCRYPSIHLPKLSIVVDLRSWPLLVRLAENSPSPCPVIGHISLRGFFPGQSQRAAAEY